MNKHEKLAFEVVREVMSEYISGYENSMSDYEEDTKEYKEAKEFLKKPHEELKVFLYDACMGFIETVGNEFYKNVKFAGKDFILNRIDKHLIKWGY